MAKKTNAPVETKAAKFRRLANQRAGKIIRGLESLGKLGGSGYESTADQRRAIEDALQGSLREAIERLNSRTAPKRDVNII